MPYCDGKPKAQVRFKYQGDSDWTIFNTKYPPVDYTTKIIPPPFTGGQCVCGVYQIKVWVTVYTNTLGKTIQEFYDCGAWFGGIKGIYINLNSGSGQYGGKKELLANCRGQADRSGAQCLSTSQGHLILTHNGGIKSFDSAVLTRVYSVPDTCGDLPSECKFTITDTRGVVYQKTTPTPCPVVEVVCGDACPPKTVCQCEKNNIVCCYDATGKPIYSYPK